MKKRNKAINSFLAVTAMAWLGQPLSIDTLRRVTDPTVEMSQSTSSTTSDRSERK